MELVKWLRLQWDRVLAVVALIAGTVLLVTGWYGVSGTEFIAKQIPYVVSEGFGGLFLVMVGGALWVSAHLSDEWAVLDRLEEQRTEAGRQRDELARRVDELEKRQTWSTTQSRV